MNNMVTVELRVSEEIANTIRRQGNERTIVLLEQWLRDQEMDALYDLRDEPRDVR